MIVGQTLAFISVIAIASIAKGYERPNESGLGNSIFDSFKHQNNFVRCTDNRERSSQLLETLQKGLKIDGKGVKVTIIGAGISGLVAAKLLMDANFHVKIVEASHRVGGRIQTFRHHGQGWLAELGAMRVTRNQPFVFTLLHKLGLKPALFLTSHAPKSRFIDSMLIESKLSDAQLRRLQTTFAIPLSENNWLRNPDRLFSQSLKQPLRDLQKMSFDDYATKYEEFSLKNWFEEEGLSEEEVDLVGVYHNLEALLDKSLIEVVLDECLYENKDTNVYSLPQGMDVLPRKIANNIGKNKIALNSRAERIEVNQENIVVRLGCKDTDCSGQSAVASDFLIVTTTAPATLAMEFKPELPAWKRLALRRTPYMASSKVVLVFLKPFWGKERVKNGGSTITDLPLKVTYYPLQWSKSGVGVMLVSYTWGGDSQRQTAMKDKNLVQECLMGLAKIFGLHLSILKKLYLNSVIKHWSLDEFSKGAFPFFEAGQYAKLQNDLRKPVFENRITFAGEHTDVPHGWIDTAIKSGVRAALEIAKESSNNGQTW